MYSILKYTSYYSLVYVAGPSVLVISVHPILVKLHTALVNLNIHLPIHFDLDPIKIQTGVARPLSRIADFFKHATECLSIRVITPYVNNWVYKKVCVY